MCLPLICRLLELLVYHHDPFAWLNWLTWPHIGPAPLQHPFPAPTCGPCPPP